MTIDSSWIQSLKSDIPNAFTPHPPFRAQAVFIDGQIKLNSPVFERTQTWDEYMKRQFLASINRYFRQPGVEAVILAFDNYGLVPNAKCMTQTKRRRHVPPVEFDSRDALPPTVPRGEAWGQFLCNRSFKSKLIDFVIYFVVTNAEMTDGQSLIIDYQSHPRRYNAAKEYEDLTTFEPLGEADVKFPRYASLYSKLQVDSIDGDSVPIGLLFVQNQQQHGMDSQISILRMVSNINDEEKKRKQEGRKFKREYEFVYINMLHTALVHEVIPQCVDRAVIPKIKDKEINLLVMLIGLSGTDFTRKIGGISGKTLYEFLPNLWLQLSVAYDEASQHFKDEQVLDRVITQIYLEKYRHHSGDGKSGYRGTLQSLMGSRLGERAKKSLLSYETTLCTVRNTNWLLQYWLHGAYPNPIQERYGFTTTAKGVVEYAA